MRRSFSLGPAILTPRSSSGGVCLPRKVKGLSGLKVLVQHLYPGRSRNQGVAHGTVSTIDSHGARRGEPHVGRGVWPQGHRPSAEPSPEHPVARTLPPSRLARDLSGGPGPPTGAALGAPPSEAAEAGRPPPLAHGGLRPARAALVPRTDCSRVAAALS